MDTQKQTTSINQQQTIPAHLWVGPHDTLVQKTKKFLQKQWCTHNGCGNCLACQQINQEQHHAVLWLMPEKGYTLEQLEIIRTTIAFQLPENEQFYFVIQKADALTTQCANSLLKCIEEPPRGYHFILLAQKADAILPTIASRCLIETSNDAANERAYETLFSFFTSTKQDNVLTFLKELDSCKIAERESMQLLDQLFEHWLLKARKALAENNRAAYEQANTVVMILKKAYLQPPMPGSSKLFWRNLYLQIKK